MDLTETEARIVRGLSVAYAAMMEDYHSKQEDFPRLLQIYREQVERIRPDQLQAVPSDLNNTRPVPNYLPDIQGHPDGHSAYTILKSTIEALDSYHYLLRFLSNSLMVRGIFLQTQADYSALNLHAHGMSVVPQEQLLQGPNPQERLRDELQYYRFKDRHLLAFNYFYKNKPVSRRETTEYVEVSFLVINSYNDD